VKYKVIEYVTKGSFDDRGKPFVSDHSFLLEALHCIANSTSTWRATILMIRRETHVSLTILDVVCFR
jgi:hypothetical protein